MTAFRLIDALGGTDALDAIFSDAAAVRALVDVEVALAQAAADVGAIPHAAAVAIARAAAPDALDLAALVSGARATGTPAIALVQALTDQVRRVDADSARYVHWAATSQDVTDTALVLLLARARPVVERDVARLDAALRLLSERHASTLMVGRTLLQPAVPITFGLKAAQWCAAVSSSSARMWQSWSEAATVQFGGAAGTRAAAGPYAHAVASALAARLGLSPSAPWHATRDRLGALVCALGLHTAALGKIARDVSLLMQPEVGEAAEPGAGSSAMPHKRNPSRCAVTLASATRVPGLVSAFLAGTIQEHERGVGGWHAEWPIVADVVGAAGAAAAAMASAMEGLTVDPARMRANLEATGGAIFAERVAARLTDSLGREQARVLVEQALARTRANGGRFGDEVRASGEIAAVISDAELATIDSPELYLGEAEGIRQQLLAGGKE